jgi:excisionase family DNA binding protein
MSAFLDAFLAELDDHALAELASRLKPYLTSNEGANDGWMNSDQAATHLACSRGRLYDLVQLGKLDPHRDGRRLVFRRSDLDQYLDSSS